MIPLEVPGISPAPSVTCLVEHVPVCPIFASEFLTLPFGMAGPLLGSRV